MTSGGEARKLASIRGCTRPGKLRLPESTATGSTPLASIWGERAPELPIQVVQPNPTIPNPSASRSSSSPERRRYNSAAGEPGASEVFTQGGGRRPLWRAFLASSPAAMSRRGSEVLVQLVIAAIATAPLGGLPAIAYVNAVALVAAAGWVAAVGA